MKFLNFSSPNLPRESLLSKEASLLSMNSDLFGLEEIIDLNFNYGSILAQVDFSVFTKSIPAPQLFYFEFRHSLQKWNYGFMGYNIILHSNWYPQQTDLMLARKKINREILEECNPISSIIIAVFSITQLQISFSSKIMLIYFVSVDKYDWFYEIWMTRYHQ